MFLCYLDESGAPELTGNTSHFVLVGLAIPPSSWRAKDDSVTAIKAPYDLAAAEIHTGWMTRRYLEQERIPGFSALDRPERRRRAALERKASLLNAAATKTPAQLRGLQMGIRKTDPYIHLTLPERVALLTELANEISTWNDSHIFCDAIDKRCYGGRVPLNPPLEEAFTQVVTRFHRFLESTGVDELGLLIADNNQAASTRLTDVMRDFYRQGAGAQYRWRHDIRQLVETPLFVDSRLTGMIQMADLCAYAVRRFFENGETQLFDRIYGRVYRRGVRLVGMRHFTGPMPCNCRVCTDHRR